VLLCSCGVFFFLKRNKRTNILLIFFSAIYDGGKTYRAFLEGRIKDNAYLLLIHLSNLELKGGMFQITGVRVKL